MAVVHPGPIEMVPDEVLRGNREQTYRFELLDHDEVQIGVLGTVQPGGGLEWVSNAAVKGSGNLNVLDIEEASDIDWRDVRIRPIITIADPTGTTGDPIVRKLGIWLPAAPVENWSATGRRWPIELTDKAGILDQQIMTNSDGEPITFSATRGTNVIGLVEDIIVGAGETANALEPSGKTLRDDLVWDIGTTRLKVINDLLQASGHFSLWCDSAGQYRASEYVPPSQRTPIYNAPLTPFSEGSLTAMSPDWSMDRDIYAVPNRYTVISNGSGDEEAMSATETNTNPDSPFSYPARGRWIDEVVTGVEATDQEALQASAVQGLAQRTSVTSSIEVKHLWLPDLRENSVIRFYNKAAEEFFYLGAVARTTVPFDPTALCETTLTEAVI